MSSRNAISVSIDSLGQAPERLQAGNDLHVVLLQFERWQRVGACEDAARLIDQVARRKGCGKFATLVRPWRNFPEGLLGRRDGGIAGLSICWPL